MTEAEIKEMMSVLGYGDKIPERMASIIMEFRKRKSALFPQELTVGDIVACTFIYDFVKGRKPSKDMANG